MVPAQNRDFLRGQKSRGHSKIDRKQINVLHINWYCFFSMLYITLKVFCHRILFRTGYSKSRLTSFFSQKLFKFKLLFKHVDLFPIDLWTKLDMSPQRVFVLICEKVSSFIIKDM